MHFGEGALAHQRLTLSTIALCTAWTRDVDEMDILVMARPRLKGACRRRAIVVTADERAKQKVLAEDAVEARAECL